MAKHVALKAPKSESKAAVWGGVLTGALMGLKADILSGGLTLGGGMLAGGVLGALGGAGLARGYNQVKGIENTDAGVDARIAGPFFPLCLVRLSCYCPFWSWPW